MPLWLSIGWAQKEYCAAAKYYAKASSAGTFQPFSRTRFFMSINLIAC